MAFFKIQVNRVVGLITKMNYYLMINTFIKKVKVSNVSKIFTHMAE